MAPVVSLTDRRVAKVAELCLALVVFIPDQTERREQIHTLLVKEHVTKQQLRKYLASEKKKLDTDNEEAVCSSR